MENKDLYRFIAASRLRGTALSCGIVCDVISLKKKRFCIRISKNSNFLTVDVLEKFEVLSDSYIYGWRLDEEGNTYYYFKFNTYETKQ